MVSVQDGKYALVNEETGEIVETFGSYENTTFVAQDAFNQADLIRPNWRKEGLKMWLKVGQQ